MTAASNTHRIARLAFILSGFAVLYLSLVVLAYATFGISWAANAGAIAQLAITAAGVVALLFLGTAFSRVLNRLWPRSLGKPAQRSGSIVVLVALALYLVGLVVALEYLIADELPGSAVGIQIMHIWHFSPVVILGALFLSAIWIATVVGTFLRHTTGPVVVTNSPYTLFLRRFSSISDDLPKSSYI